PARQRRNPPDETWSDTQASTGAVARWFWLHICHHPGACDIPAWRKELRRVVVLLPVGDAIQDAVGHVDRVGRGVCRGCVGCTSLPDSPGRKMGHRLHCLADRVLSRAGDDEPRQPWHPPHAGVISIFRRRGWMRRSDVVSMAAAAGDRRWHGPGLWFGG